MGEVKLDRGNHKSHKNNAGFWPQGKRERKKSECFCFSDILFAL